MLLNYAFKKKLFIYYIFWYACAGQLSASEERVQVALEELQDLKGVWSELSKIWEQIDEMKDKPWLSVAPRKVGWSVCYSLKNTHVFTCSAHQIQPSKHILCPI